MSFTQRTGENAAQFIENHKEKAEELKVE